MDAFGFHSFAYWGVLHGNFTIAQQAHKQIKAYRDLMRDPATGFWRHVTHNGQWEGAFSRTKNRRCNLSGCEYHLTLTININARRCQFLGYWYGLGSRWYGKVSQTPVLEIIQVTPRLDVSLTRIESDAGHMPLTRMDLSPIDWPVKWLTWPIGQMRS